MRNIKAGFDPHTAWSLDSYSQDWPECSGSHGCSSPEPQPVGGKINTASQPWDEIQRHRPGTVIIVNVQTWLAALESLNRRWSWKQIGGRSPMELAPETEQLGRALMREEPLTRRERPVTTCNVSSSLWCAPPRFTAKLKDCRKTHKRKVLSKGVYNEVCAVCRCFWNSHTFPA